MSRAMNLDGVPKFKAPRKKRRTKQQRLDALTQRAAPPSTNYQAITATVPMIDVTCLSDEFSQYVAPFSVVQPLEYGDDWMRRRDERMRNKVEFGLSVLDKELPAKFRKQRKKEKDQ